MRAACIDIGSNTSRLLVAEPSDDGRLSEVVGDRAFTRLTLTRGVLPEAKITELTGIVAAQARLARDLGTDALRAVATGVIRAAANRDGVIARLSHAAAIRVELLDPEQEARLAFAGATRMLVDPPEGEVAVVDVGGGSTELAVGTVKDGVAWWRSLPVGSGTLAVELTSDPPAAPELARAAMLASREFADMRCPAAAGAWAVGGSAQSLQRLVGAALSTEALDHALAVLSTDRAATVAAVFEIPVERAILLPAGLLLLREAARALDCPLHVGHGGLREGIVLEELAGLGQSG